MPPPPTPNPATAAAQLLEKKATFAQGCQQLMGLLESPNELESADQIFNGIQRARTLLNCRYTNPGFWRAASSLFKSASRASVFREAQRAQLEAWMCEASNFLSEGDEGESSSGASGGAPQHQRQQHQRHVDPDTLMQNLMGFQVSPQSAFDDAGYVQPQQPSAARSRQESSADRAGNFMLELLESQQGRGGQQQQEQQQEQEQQQQQEQEEGNASRPQGAENGGNPTRQHLLDILQAVEAVQSGVGSLSRNTEAIRNELDAVIMALAARSSEESVREQRPVPPASKEAIARLPLFTWDEAKQQQQETQSVCSICTEVLQVGDQVQSLPCHKTHLFHPACLHPWLSKSNACPVCREELPTDDLDYEAEKERKAEQEKERRGVQNALGHNEFMYM